MEKNPFQNQFRVWKLLAFGVALVYGVSWIPAIAFYWEFQRGITAHASSTTVGAVLNVRPEPLDASPAPEAEGGDLGKGWIQILHGDFLLTLPPGDVVDIHEETNTLVVEYTNGKVLVDRFPPGFLQSLFLTEFQRIGGEVEELPRAFLALDDAALLERISCVTPGEYRLGMKENERTVYAAEILTKLLLWDVESIREGYILEGKDRRGIFIREESGRVRLLVATPQGIFAFGVRGELIDSPMEGAGLWLEILPVNEDLLQLWVETVQKKYPESHPVRRWASSKTDTEKQAAPSGHDQGQEEGNEG